MLEQFLPKLSPSDLLDGATAFGPMREDIPVAPILKGSEVAGYAFVTSDFVGSVSVEPSSSSYSESSVPKVIFW